MWIRVPGKLINLALTDAIVIDESASQATWSVKAWAGGEMATMESFPSYSQAQAYLDALAAKLVVPAAPAVPAHFLAAAKAAVNAVNAADIEKAPAAVAHLEMVIRELEGGAP